MKKKNLVLVLSILIIIVLLGVAYFLLNLNSGSESYSECVENFLADARVYNPAIEEPIGTTRIDEEGRVWTKSERISKYSGEHGWVNPEFEASFLSNEVVDSFPGGAEYAPTSIPECERLLS